MAKGTRYTRIVAPKQIAKTDFANVTTQIRATDALVNNISRMGDFIYGQQLRKKRKEEAIQERIDFTNNVNSAVNKALSTEGGAKKYLSNLSERGGPESLEEIEIRNTLEKFVAKKFILDTTVKLNNTLKYAQDNNLTSDEYNNLLETSILGSFASTQDFFDDATRQNLLLDLQASGDTLKNNFNNWRNNEDLKLQRLEFEGEFKDYINHFEQEAKRLAITNALDDENFGNNIDLFFEKVETIKNSMRTMQYTEAAIKSYEQSAIKSFYESFIVNGTAAIKQDAFNQPIEVTQGEITKLVNTVGDMLGIGELDKANTIERISNDLKQIQKVNVTKGKDLLKEIDGKVTNLSKGMILPDNYINDTLEQINNLYVTDDVKQGLIAKVNELQYFDSLSKSITKMSLQQLEVLAQNIEAKGLEGFGQKGRDIDIEEDVFDFINKKIQSKKQNIETGNFHHDAILNGIISETPPIINFTADSNLDVKDIKENTRIRINQASVLKAHYGLDYLPILNNTEIDLINQTLQSNDPKVTVEDKILVIDNVVSGIGAENIDDIMRQLAPKDAYLSTIAYLVHSGNAQLATKALKGKQYGTTKGMIFGDDYEKPDKEKVIRDTDQEGALLLIDPKERAAIYQIADDVYKDEYQRNPNIAYNETFYNTVQLAVGANGDYGGIQEVRGVMTVIPQNMNVNDFEEMVEAIIEDPSVYKEMSKSETNPNGIELSSFIREAIKDEDYEIKFVSHDTYYIVLDPLGNNPTMLSDENGDLIRIHPSKYKKKRYARDRYKEATKQ